MGEEEGEPVCLGEQGGGSERTPKKDEGERGQSDETVAGNMGCKNPPSPSESKPAFPTQMRHSRFPHPQPGEVYIPRVGASGSFFLSLRETRPKPESTVTICPSSYNTLPPAHEDQTWGSEEPSCLGLRDKRWSVFRIPE